MNLDDRDLFLCNEIDDTGEKLRVLRLSELKTHVTYDLRFNILGNTHGVYNIVHGCTQSDVRRKMKDRLSSNVIKVSEIWIAERSDSYAVPRD